MVSVIPVETTALSVPMHWFAMIGTGASAGHGPTDGKEGAKRPHKGWHGGSHATPREKEGRYAMRNASDRIALESSLRSVLNRKRHMAHDRGSYGGDRSETMEVLSCDVARSCSQLVSGVVTGALAVGRTTRAQETTPDAMAGHPLVGTWIVDRNPADPSGMPTTNIITADGGLIDPSVGAAGVWAATGERTADFTLIALFEREWR